MQLLLVGTAKKYLSNLWINKIPPTHGLWFQEGKTVKILKAYLQIRLLAGLQKKKWMCITSVKYIVIKSHRVRLILGVIPLQLLEL